MPEELAKIGFVKAGSWVLRDGDLAFNLTEAAQESEVLYAFVVNNVVKYLGKTSRSLKTRMRGYWKPGPKQSTNIRNHARIEKALQDGMEVNIYVLTDVAGLTYQGHAIKLADGLESTLIRTLKPGWNDQGKNSKAIGPNEKKKSSAGIAPMKRRTRTKVEFGIVEFPIKLGVAYYNQGFFNIRVEHENYFDEDGAYVLVYLENDPEPINAKINRRANKNGVPRIMAGPRYRDWVQSKFKFGDEFLVQVQKDRSLRLGHTGA